MRQARDSFDTLRADAQSGVRRLLEFAAVGRSLGMTLPSDASIRARMATVDRFDVAALSADSRRLLVAHRAVAEHLHRLPEQQIRLDRGWGGAAGADAIVAVISHQRKAESDLHVLRTLSEATTAAAAGIDRLLRTFMLSMSRLTTPTVAGCPLAELPAAVLTARVPLDVVVADIASRFELFTTGVDAVSRGVQQILEILNRSTAGLTDEPYPEPRGTRSDISYVEHRSMPHAEQQEGATATSTLGTGISGAGQSDPATAGPVTSNTLVAGGADPAEPAASRAQADVPLRLGEPAPTPSTGPRPSPEVAASAGDLALAGDQ